MLRWLPPGVELMNDVTPAAWVMQRLKPWAEDGVRLESFAPDGYEAYARVFHPAGSRPGRRWADLAAERGLALAPDITFAEVSGIGPQDDPGLDERNPMPGELAPETCDALGTILRAHSASDTGWFCLWEGNGAFWSRSHDSRLPDDAHREEIERERAEAEAQDRLLAATPRATAYRGLRAYFLLRGPLEAACAFEIDGWYTSPNLWWPQDRAWIVVTEIEGYSTYVGGCSALIEDLVASTEIEAIGVGLDVRMDPEDRLPRWR